ncbi:ABC transporter permease [Verrucomicrobium sp. 3C]|uniref:ABC transporter permease n=1 Tax=Verrucomicrobium sp. 3C TaxID=1134055 RepID=UPI000371BE27|nr:ABC transporter permease [Verrucomicrobium sp. 3C]
MNPVLTKRSGLWQQVIARPQGALALGLLGFLYLCALFAPLLAPYGPGDQDLQKPYHPPTGFTWTQDGLAVRLYENADPTQALYRPIPGKTATIHWFPAGHPYRLFGLLPCRRHLFGVEPPQKIYLLGSDSTGRDVFSRLLYGAQVSLSIGLIGISISLGVGLIAGGLAGYFGGWFDSLVMRTTELLMAIPGLYLLLALRGAFASQFGSGEVYLLIVVILSFLGWSGAARVIRGLTLSLRAQTFVEAAIVTGLSPWRILWRHLLPNLASYLLVAAALSIPGYILGEAALSFLGIGIQEPSASWGLMLAQAQEMKVFMCNFWWLLSPGAAVFVTVAAFNLLGDTLRDVIDPHFRTSDR